MYKIIGSDGREYGPISADVVHAWVQQGRANGQTRVLPEGATEWTTLSACAEFAAMFAASPGVSSGAAAKPKSSGMAITSMVMGILSIVSCGITFIITTPLGLILGIIALTKINKSEGRLAGKGMALAGIIISGVSIVFIPIFAAMLLPALAKAKSKSQSIACLNNCRQLSLAAVMYADDNSDKFPSATNWCEAVQTYAGSPNTFVCPARKDQSCGFAFNSALSGLKTGDIDSMRRQRVVVFFESDAGWNGSGGKALLASKPRHGNGYVVGFADGHCEVVMPSRISQLDWGPEPVSKNE